MMDHFLKSFFSLLTLVLFLVRVNAQSFSVIHSSALAGDTSYYDILRISNTEFLLAGEYGVLRLLNTEDQIREINYPNKGNSLLNIAFFGANNIIIAGDHGTICFYNTVSKECKVDVLNKYMDHAFYSVLAINDSVAFICGGKSKVADGRKTIPSGFIIKTVDKGKNWTRCYENKFNMVWDLAIDNDKIYSIIYTPHKSTIICSQDEGKTWKKTSIENKWLFHEYQGKNNSNVVGGNINGDKEKGVILNIVNHNKTVLDGTGMFWDVDESSSFSVATGSDGVVAYKRVGSDGWDVLHSPVPKHLYGIEFINDSSAYIVGREKTILKIKWNEINLKK